MYVFKQISSIFLTLTISVVLLGFDIVPHHHHGNMPCFAIEENTCSHNDCRQQEEEEICALEQFVVAPAKIYNDGSFNVTYDQPENLFQAILLSILYDFTIPVTAISDWEFPYLISYHSIVAAHGAGLRAPPAI
jgi:hypothetical protein